MGGEGLSLWETACEGSKVSAQSMQSKPTSAMTLCPWSLASSLCTTLKSHHEGRQEAGTTVSPFHTRWAHGASSRAGVRCRHAWIQSTRPSQNWRSSDILVSLIFREGYYRCSSGFDLCVNRGEQGDSYLCPQVDKRCQLGLETKDVLVCFQFLQKVH